MAARPRTGARQFIPSSWKTDSGIDPVLHTLCEHAVVKEIAEAVEQGAPLSVSLDLAGVPEEVFREWVRRAQKKEEPYIWATTMIRKAQASYIYNNIIDLNMAEGAAYKKYLEILKLRDPQNFGGDGIEMAEEEFGPEFM